MARSHYAKHHAETSGRGRSSVRLRGLPCGAGRRQGEVPGLALAAARAAPPAARQGRGGPLCGRSERRPRRGVRRLPCARRGGARARRRSCALAGGPGGPGARHRLVCMDPRGGIERIPSRHAVLPEFCDRGAGVGKAGRNCSGGAWRLGCCSGRRSVGRLGRRRELVEIVLRVVRTEGRQLVRSREHDHGNPVRFRRDRHGAITRAAQRRAVRENAPRR